MRKEVAPARGAGQSWETPTKKSLDLWPPSQPAAAKAPCWPSGSPQRRQTGTEFAGVGAVPQDAEQGRGQGRMTFGRTRERTPNTGSHRPRCASLRAEEKAERRGWLGEDLPLGALETPCWTLELVHVLMQQSSCGSLSGPLMSPFQGTWGTFLGRHRHEVNPACRWGSHTSVSMRIARAGVTTRTLSTPHPRDGRSAGSGGPRNLHFDLSPQGILSRLPSRHLTKYMKLFPILFLVTSVSFFLPSHRLQNSSSFGPKICGFLSGEAAITFWPKPFFSR